VSFPFNLRLWEISKLTRAQQKWYLALAEKNAEEARKKK